MVQRLSIIASIKSLQWRFHPRVILDTKQNARPASKDMVWKGLLLSLLLWSSDVQSTQLYILIEISWSTGELLPLGFKFLIKNIRQHHNSFCMPCAMWLVFPTTDNQNENFKESVNIINKWEIFSHLQRDFYILQISRANK